MLSFTQGKQAPHSLFPPQTPCAFFLSQFCSFCSCHVTSTSLFSKEQTTLIFLKGTYQSPPSAQSFLLSSTLEIFLVSPESHSPTLPLINDTCPFKYCVMVICVPVLFLLLHYKSLKDNISDWIIIISLTDPSQIL